MGVIERYRKQQESEANKGKPLGGGLDERPAPSWGSAALADLRVEKPVEKDGKRGMRVAYRVQAKKLPKARIVLEVTLHEQGGGQFKSASPALADTSGALNVWEVWRPLADEAEEERAAFIPFEAIAVDRAGTLRCLARVRALEADRGCLAEAEVAFSIETG